MDAKSFNRQPQAQELVITKKSFNRVGIAPRERELRRAGRCPRG